MFKYLFILFDFYQLISFLGKKALVSEFILSSHGSGLINKTGNYLEVLENYCIYITVIVMGTYIYLVCIHYSRFLLPHHYFSVLSFQLHIH